MMATISRDTPCLYITAVCKDRLPVFRIDALKEIACSALDEAQMSGKFVIFAYVIMPDHIHVITDGARKASDTLRYVKGISGHRLIEYLKAHNHQRSLEKLRHAERERRHTYSLWQQESNVLSLTSESFFMQKVNYTHQNPVRAGLVESAVDYRWSSARCWAGGMREDEPLNIDVKKVVWRASR